MAGQWKTIAGACGILAPLVAFAGIFGAIYHYPEFSWQSNALSDLGVVGGMPSALFNWGLVAAGALSLLFSTRLPSVLPGKTGLAASVLFALVSLDLAAIGIFTEEFEPTHYYASLFFFIAFPISLFLAASSLYREGQKNEASLTIFLSLVAVLAWALQEALGFGANVAIPETIAALACGAWAALMGRKMLEKTRGS